MDNNKENTNKKTKFEIERVYVGKKPMEEVFENIIEHILEGNIITNSKEKDTHKWYYSWTIMDCSGILSVS